MKKMKIKHEGIKYMIQYIEPTVVKEQESSFNKCDSADDAYNLIKNIQDSAKEKFIGIYLNSRNRVICIEIISVGSTIESLVTPRDSVKTALLVNAVGIVYAHNHPSGDPTPSQEDKNITQRLAHACNTLNMRLLDHIIIGDNTFYSFSQHGIL